jgi:anti-sigma factor RsiW|nr:zf-HC2 domain-containing protein [Candidatus Krumholzibacteria bacterium]
MKHVTGQIQNWLSGELPRAESRALEDHLESCAACAAEAAEARVLWESLEAGAVSPDGPSLWPAIRSRTVGRAERPAWFFGQGRLAQSSLAVAAVAAGLVLGVFFPGDQGQIGGEAEALDTADTSVESLWLTGSSWAGGFTDLQSDWLTAGETETETTGQEGS